MRDFYWTGVFQYKGKKPARFGTVQAHDAQEARDKLKEAFEEILPFDAPDFEPERGSLIFHQDNPYV